LKVCAWSTTYFLSHAAAAQFCARTPSNTCSHMWAAAAPVSNWRQGQSCVTWHGIGSVWLAWNCGSSTAAYGWLNGSFMVRMAFCVGLMNLCSLALQDFIETKQ
jgi:hypothetical protein